MEGETIYYLYRHIRLDKNEPFYIGIGKKPKKFNSFYSEYVRAHNKRTRNIIWKRIVAKTEYQIEILLESDNREFIKSREVEMVNLYGRKDLGTGILANRTKGGDYISESAIQRNIELKSKPVYQFDKRGILLMRWSSSTIAAKELNIDRTIISHTAVENNNGKNWSYGGYIWRYNDELCIPTPLPSRGGKNHYASKEVYQYSQDGLFVKKWDCGKDIEREMNFKAESIYASCNKGSIAYNCKWFHSYQGENIKSFKLKEAKHVKKPVYMIDERSSRVWAEFDSINSAALWLNKDKFLKTRTKLYKILKSNDKIGLGYRWSFK